MEDAIIDFFREKEFSCEIEGEERGRTVIDDSPEYFVIIDPLDGTTNFSKGIPLTCYGLAIARLKNNSINATFEDIIAASVRSFHTDELFMSNISKGSFLNNKPIKPSKVKQLEGALIAFDLDKNWGKKERLNKILKVLVKCRGTRRFGANILDMCYVASGKIEIVIDIRNFLSAVHTPGLFIAKESGAIINSTLNDKFNPKLLANEKMGFILCCNEELNEQIMKLILD
jgi:myo-inositol-1(or 4)-monophosphatase